jgi:hypothetical protein
MQRALDLASAVATHLDAVARRPGRRARRSVGQHTVSSMPPSLAGSALKPASPTSTRGGQPPCRIPTKGAHPLRNSQAGCYPASRLRAPVSRGDCAISRRTVMNNAGLQAAEKLCRHARISRGHLSETSPVCLVIWSVWSIWFIRLIWFNQINKTNQTNQLNETDQTDRTDQMNKTGWRTFSASC